MALFVNPLGPKIGKGQVKLQQAPWAPPKTLPEAIMVGGARVLLWTFQQLEEVSGNNLKQRALDLSDVAGDKLPPLQKSAPHHLVSKWIIEAQIILARETNLHLTEADFGLPTELMAPAQQLSEKERKRIAEAGYPVPIFSNPAAPGGASHEGDAAPTAPKPGQPSAFMQRVSTTQAHFADPALSPSKGENVRVGVPARLGPPLRLG